MSIDQCKELTKWYALAEDIYPFTIGLITVSTVSTLPIVVLNGLILTAIVRTPTLHTPSNILTCNLAAANLGVAFFVYPVGLSWKILELYNHGERDACLTGILCYMLNTIFSGASILTILFATVDRYLALVLHLRYQTLVTIRRVLVSCAVIWILSLSLVFSLLNGPRELYNITVGIIMALFIAISAFCYSQIFTIIRRHHNQIASQAFNTTAIFPNLSRYRKSVFSLIYVMCFQLIIATPHIICLSVLAASGASVEILRFWSISNALVFLNPLLNPLLIYTRYGQLRLAVKETARNLWSKIRRKD